MKTYKSYNELKGNTLAYEDKVIMDNHEYTVCMTFLRNISGENNSYIFKKYDIARNLADTVYGYKTTEGDWPCSRVDDYKALTRLVLVLFQFLEGKQEAEFDIDGDKFLVSKSGANKLISAKKELTVPSEFVRQAHEAACSEWKLKIEKQFPELFKVEEYPIGTRVMLSLCEGNSEFILASLKGDAYLIQLSSGIVWTSTKLMKIVDNKVSHSELKRYLNTTPFRIL
jgi:hypothetical protein